MKGKPAIAEFFPRGEANLPASVVIGAMRDGSRRARAPAALRGKAHGGVRAGERARGRARGVAAEGVRRAWRDPSDHAADGVHGSLERAGASAEISVGAVSWRICTELSLACRGGSAAVGVRGGEGEGVRDSGGANTRGDEREGDVCDRDRDRDDDPRRSYGRRRVDVDAGQCRVASGSTRPGEDGLGHADAPRVGLGRARVPAVRGAVAVHRRHHAARRDRADPDACRALRRAERCGAGTALQRTRPLSADEMRVRPRHRFHHATRRAEDLRRARALPQRTVGEGIGIMGRWRPGPRCLPLTRPRVSRAGHPRRRRVRRWARGAVCSTRERIDQRRDPTALTRRIARALNRHRLRAEERTFDGDRDEGVGSRVLVCARGGVSDACPAARR